MKLKEVIKIGTQSKEGIKQHFITYQNVFNGTNKKVISEWQGLTMYTSRNHYVVVKDNNIVFGFDVKSFQQGISIVWAENYSNGAFRNLFKEIIFELLRSGVKEIYTDNKHSAEMILSHEKIINELPYSQVRVEKFNSNTNEVTSSLNGMYGDSDVYFKFTRKNAMRDETFKEEIKDTMWESRIISSLNNSLGHTDEEFTDNIEYLVENVDDNIVKEIFEGAYYNMVDFFYEYTSWT